RDGNGRHRQSSTQQLSARTSGERCTRRCRGHQAIEQAGHLTTSLSCLLGMKRWRRVVSSSWSGMDQSSSFENQLAALLPRLRRVAHALSRNPADADDLTQATIERALRSRDQWRPGTKLDSWCYRIMRNLWIDTVR